MEIIDLIMTRRSIRRYTPEVISDQDLKDILNAGLYAPSAINLQPWYFVALRSPEKMKLLTEVMAKVSVKIKPDLQEHFSRHPEVVEESTTFIRQLGGAPVCVLAFQFKPEYPKTADSISQSIGAAIENMLIMAKSKGIGSCWLTAPLETANGEELRQLFAPGNGELKALVTLGYAEQEPRPPKRRDGRFVII